ncbi:MFS general substrate transporter [Patellaria atrata CBS 101060]|uniref:MFS general substrate transporter n=1 Tax=Patellaria atrata CBS 101060 TaxID=1346257 RepID=A0A9P4S4I2_9PEZI|nr:MFS general substrate transporter [Patellaria atrata CBS 101060]
MARSSFLRRLSTLSGFSSVIKVSSDAKLLFLQRFVRLFAYGATFLILVHFLSELGIPDDRIGLFMTFTMLGDVVIGFVLTLITDQVGRRNVLATGAVLMAASGAVFSFTSTYWVLVLASVIGVISPSGNEIGPFRAIEESILAQLTNKDDRSDIFAWYTMCGTAGAALGTLTTGWIVQALQSLPGWTNTSAYRFIFVLYGMLGIVKLVLTLILSRRIEVERTELHYQEAMELQNEGLLSDSTSDLDHEDANNPSATRFGPLQAFQNPPLLSRVLALLPKISSASISILSRLIILFTFDSFASGLASPSWLTYFFTTVHSFQPSTLGTLFFYTNVLATFSNLLALPLARRLGPLKTMTFTHLPSAIFLGLIPFPPPTRTGSWFAVTLLSLRACTQSMDQAPRQAFLAAVVLPTERTAILGIVNVTKTLAQAGGIGTAGVLVKQTLWVQSLGGAGALKASYDLLILWTFLGMKDRGG